MRYLIQTLCKIMEPISVSKILSLSVILCIAWFVQFFGWSSFKQAYREGKPNPTIVEMTQTIGEDGETEIGVQYHNLPVGGVPLRAYGHKEAENIVNSYYMRKWLGLAAAIIGAIVLWGSCYFLADDKILGIAAIFLGPIVVAYCFYPGHSRA